MIFWILAAFAVSACSVTLARSMMMRWYRVGIQKAASKMGENTGEWIGYLSRCHYCTSHWISAIVVAVYKPPVGGLFIADLFLAWLALVGGAAIISGVLIFFTPFRSED